MNDVKLPVGRSYFADIRRDHYYYIDKTGLIRELLHQDAQAFLFTRPRRFGKTLTMSMLSAFFDIRQESTDLFHGLEIMRDPALCDQWMNRYPVIFVSFRGAEGLDFSTAFQRYEGVLADLFREHEYLADSSRLRQEDRSFIRRMIERKAAKGEVETALSSLTRMLEQHYGRPAILLIDEYDVPLAAASRNGYYREMLDVMRSVMSVLKDNRFLKLAVVTGCLRIAKESIFTGTNNMVTNTVLDKGYGEYYGFTQKEVDQLLRDTGLTEYAAEIREWYDGYRIGEAAVYCPWDVVNYVSDRTGDRIDAPKCYWSNSSDNAILRSFIDEMGPSVTKSFETLLSGGTITQTIRVDLTYDTLWSGGQKAVESSFWSVLFMTGYLTRTDSSGTSGMVREEGVSYMGQTVALRIPNREIRIVFEQTVMIWFQETVRSWDRKALFAAVWNGDSQTLEGELNRLLRRTISYHDYREDYYHAFLAGVFAGAGYDVESNREHGEGRSDIVVRDLYGGRAAVFELKYAYAKTGLPASCEEAVRQIAGKGYSQDLEEECGEVLCYGIAFYKKSCMVRKA